MRNFTWNRFPIKNLLINSLLTPIVESTYLKRLSLCHIGLVKEHGGDLVNQAVYHL